MLTAEMLNEYKNSVEQLEKFKNDLKTQRVVFDAANEVLFENIKTATRILNEHKQDLEIEAMTEHSRTGEKKLLGGLGIRVGTNLIYEPETALDWAKEHQLCLLLDKKLFEQLAKTNAPDFVEKKDKITVTFPKEIILE